MLERNPSVSDIDASPDMGYFIFRADGKKHSHRPSRRAESSFYHTYEEARRAASTPGKGASR